MEGILDVAQFCVEQKALLEAIDVYIDKGSEDDFIEMEMHQQIKMDFWLDYWKWWYNYYRRMAAYRKYTKMDYFIAHDLPFVYDKALVYHHFVTPLTYVKESIKIIKFWHF